MLKKFSFWIVFVLIASIGSIVFIHWRTLQGIHQRTARIHPLHQRHRIIDSLTLGLERYRRMSSSFRKLSPEDLAEVKGKLKSTFVEGIAKLDQLDPSAEERASERQLNEQLNELLRLSAHFEPLLFTKDAYLKPEVLATHEEILSTLSKLGRSARARLDGLQTDFSQSESEALMLLLGMGGVIFTLMICMIVRGHLVHVKPLKKLYLYAQDLKSGKPIPQNPPHFPGMYGEIQSTLNQLALGVETHMRDRHKFILDIVADLRAPLELLQSGRYLLGDSENQIAEEKQLQAAESVRRGLAIFSGSLDDLNDIVDINRLESRLEEKTVDLSELLSDASRTIMGSELGKKVMVSVPPIPVWAHIDARRFERVIVHVLSKVIATVPEGGGGLAITVSQPNQGNFRGVEILIQDADRLRNGRSIVGGPEQDILKHWISEHGLTMALAHKIIKAHGGTMTAAGVAGMSVTVMIRLPQERVASRGLISPPTTSSVPNSLSTVRGLVVQRESMGNQGSII